MKDSVFGTEANERLYSKSDEQLTVVSRKLSNDEEPESFNPIPTQQVFSQKIPLKDFLQMGPLDKYQQYSKLVYSLILS